MVLPMPRIIHHRIKAEQRKAQLTDEQVAQALGCTVSWWRSYLGDVVPADRNRAISILRLLPGLSWDDLWWQDVVEHRPVDRQPPEVV